MFNSHQFNNIRPKQTFLETEQYEFMITNIHKASVLLHLFFFFEQLEQQQENVKSLFEALKQSLPISKDM